MNFVFVVSVKNFNFKISTIKICACCLFVVKLMSNKIQRFIIFFFANDKNHRKHQNQKKEGNSRFYFEIMLVLQIAIKR